MTDDALGSKALNHIPVDGDSDILSHDSNKCDVCGNFFESGRDLKDHVEAEHDTSLDQNHNEEKVKPPDKAEPITVEQARKIMNEVFGNLKW